MSDLVERLRAVATHGGRILNQDIFVEAADEIERLREELAEFRNAAADEIERLRWSAQANADANKAMAEECAQLKGAAAEVGAAEQVWVNEQHLNNAIAATIERCAQWHDEQEKLFRSNSGDHEYQQVADWHKNSAAAMRAMKDRP